LVVLFSGKLSEKKGVNLLLTAVRKLPEALQSRLHLLLVGDGPLRDDLLIESLTPPKLSASFVGFQNQDSLSAYYNAADLLVLPSCERETWGVVVNEALINGLPCIVSDRVGCQPDLVHSGLTGEVFAANDVAALAQAIESLASRVPSAIVSDQCSSPQILRSRRR
jgi:glycosyltransferase involved in cell wall biosynthesis